MASDLMNSTAMMGNNLPDIPEPESLAKLAHSGFDMNSKAGIQKGKANQTVAFAVLGLYLYWTEFGHPEGEDVPDLKLVVETSKDGKEARAQIKKIMTVALIETPAEGDTYDRQADIKARRTADGMILNRAIGFASICHRAGVTLRHYNRKLFMFEPPAYLLFPKGVTPIGRCSGDNARVLLNNRGIMGEKADGKKWEGVASFDQLSRAYRETHELTGGRNLNPKVSLKEIKPDALAKGVSLSKLVLALNKAIEDKLKSNTLNPRDMPVECWRELTNIAFNSDEIQKREAFVAYFANSQGQADPSPAIEAEGDAA